MIDDTPSRIVRERRLGCGKRKAARYTLTYSEGTILELDRQGNNMIHPHV